MIIRLLACLFLCLLFILPIHAQEHSEARVWNEILLEAIRNDQARPVVHARNLFHLSAGAYDLWAVITGKGSPFFLGRSINGVSFEFTPTELPAYNFTEEEAVERAIAVYSRTILEHRFRGSNARDTLHQLIDEHLAGTGLSTTFFVPDYLINDPGNLGSYLARRVIAFGLEDGANELEDYRNITYEPVNEPLNLREFGVEELQDPDRWQPLAFEIFVDQSGNTFDGNTPEFLGAEWGNVTPFALPAEELTILSRPGESGEWKVYHDPGPPPSFYDYQSQGNESFYRWNFELVAKWASHLTTEDGVVWDISPASLGNIGVENYPTTDAEYKEFYDEFEGGDPGSGHALNPVTGQPYPPNLVPRGDYARVLAEFWADGPDSETPPGHWFTIANTVMDHPLFERKYRGEGEELTPLEYDIKLYLALAGAMHDAAIATWSIKGYYDYIRPISAIRNLARLGQRTTPGLVAPYNEAGIGLVEGYVKPISSSADIYGINVSGNIGMYTWLGNFALNQFDNADTSAGVGWINALTWEPYQRPTFVTPNFAGYVSGHSTFSSAAAQVLETITGNPYFPGGVGEFFAPKDSFLVFEQGPSVPVTLQWATYRDASDQTSLSRIWGGIHPPVDDIPGRKIGIEVGNDAVQLAEQLFSGQPVCPATAGQEIAPILTPNVVRSGDPLRVKFDCNRTDVKTVVVYNQLGQQMGSKEVTGELGSFDTSGWRTGTYYVREIGAPKSAVSVAVVIN